MRQTRNWYVAALTTVILLATVFSLPLQLAAETDSDILLGMSAAFSGPNSGLGIEFYRGAQTWFDHLNRRNGLNGRRIRIVPCDDGYQPDPAIYNAVRLLNDDNILALFGFTGTPTVSRVLPVLKLYAARNALLFFPVTGAQQLRTPPFEQFIFNLRASYRDETASLVDRFLLLGRSRIAVFYQADAYGRSAWDGVREALMRYGLEMVCEATYRRGAAFTERMDRQVKIIQQSRPDAIIAVGAYAPCAAFIRDARDAGLDVPIANLSFAAGELLLRLLQEAGQANGTDYTKNLVSSQVVPSYEDVTLPGIQEYRALMDDAPSTLPVEFRAPDPALRYSFASLEGFLSARVMTCILEKAGPRPSRTSLLHAAQSLASLDLGIGAIISFSPANHNGLNQVFLTTVENGRFMPLETWSGQNR